VGDTRGDRIRNEGLACFGKITAGQSHEVTNVLNIINELAGLQQDVLLSANHENYVHLSKLKEICHKIQLQVARGETIIRNINLFAHSVDAPIAVFDVKEAISRIVFLAQRWTRLKKVELRARFPDTTTAIENSPFLFQCAVFVCIDAALLAAADRRQVSVSYSVTGDGAEVVVASSDPVPRTQEVMTRVASLRALVGELGGELRALPGAQDANCFIFFVSTRAPRSASNDSAVAQED
jgi:C4-dicarboxylate-specific signal transduction histidine kinase